MNTIINAVLFSFFITSCVATLLFIWAKSSLVKYAVIAVSGSVMIAHGSRIILQTLLYPESYYKPGFFDLIFDWLTLIILGFFVASYGFERFYQYRRQMYQKKENKL